MRILRPAHFAIAAVAIVALSSCSQNPVLPESSSAWVIPEVPENSDHGYLLEDDRIPSLSSCEEWGEFWVLGGPAVSFGVAKENPQVADLAVSTQIFLKNQNLDHDSNGIICDEERASETEPVGEEKQDAATEDPEDDIVHAVIDDIRSFRNENLNSVSDTDFDSFGGPAVDKAVLDHYVGSVERAASFWAQFNDGESLVRSVSVFSHDERDVFEQRRTELGLPGWGDDWWQRSTKEGGGTVAKDQDGYSHVLFRLHPTGGGFPQDDYAFHEVTHSYQDGFGAFSAEGDVCWFPEGYAMVVGLANTLPSESENLSWYKDRRREAIGLLRAHFSEQDETLSAQLTRALGYGHSHIQCNTEEPLFGYRLGLLVSELWVAEFGFEKTVNFMKMLTNENFEEKFEVEFGLPMEDWLNARAMPYVLEILSEQ